MVYKPNKAIQEMISHWNQSGQISFKGRYISKDDNGNIVMGFQGQILSKLGRFTEKELFNLSTIREADQETAKFLKISLTHSVFLRYIINKFEESPQVVLSNPAKYLGRNFRKVLSFWKFIDTLGDRKKEAVFDGIRGILGDYEMHLAAEDSKLATDNLIGADYRNVALSAVYFATKFSTPGIATLEIIGDVNNKVLYHIIKNLC